MHNVFHISPLEQDNTKKKWMNEFTELPEFETDDDKEYKVEVIWESTVYAKKVDRYLPRLYYLVVWKGYLKEKNTWKPSLVVMYFYKMVNTFHKNHPKKSTVTLALLDSAPSMVKLTIQLPQSGNKSK